jgi:WD40 repeat protein
MALSADGRWLIAAGRDLRAWYTGGAAWPPPLALERVSDDAAHLYVAASTAPSGQRFAVSDRGGEALIYDMPSAETAPAGAQPGAPPPTCALATGAIEPRGLAFFDDLTLLVGGADGIVRGWDAQTCQPTDLRLLVGAAVRRLALSADRQWLAVLTPTEVQLWDLTRRARLESLQPDPHGVMDVAFTSEGRALLTAGVSGLAHLWQTRTAQGDRALGQHTQQVIDLSLSPHGRLLLSTDAGGALSLWRTDTDSPLPPPPVPAGERALGGHLLTDAPTPLWLITAHPDGHWLLRDPRRDAATSLGKPSALGVIRRSRHWALSANGKALAFLDSSGRVAVWDLFAAPRGPTLRGHVLSALQVPDHVALSADGQRLAAGDALGRVAVWDVPSAAAPAPSGGLAVPALRWTLGAHTEAISALALAPDGRLLATGSRDARVTLWDAATGEALHTLSGHTAHITALAFSPDGAQALSASQDNTLSLWDTASGARLRTIPTRDPVLRAHFSPDAASLILAEGARVQSLSLSADIWDIPPADLVARAQADAGLSLDDLSGSTARASRGGASPRVATSGAVASAGRVFEITGTSQRRPLPDLRVEAVDPQTLAPLPYSARTGADGAAALGVPASVGRFGLKLTRGADTLYDLSAWLRGGQGGWEVNWIAPTLLRLMLFEAPSRTIPNAVTVVGVAASGAFSRYGDAEPVGCARVTLDAPDAHVLYTDDALRPRRAAPHTHSGSGAFIISNLSPDQPFTLTLTTPDGAEQRHALPALPPDATAYIALPSPPCP